MATISAEQMALYRQTAIRLAQQDREQLVARYERAQRTADRAAQWLRDEYAVDQIVVFGSLVHREQFHSHSDIDLAVKGLPEAAYFGAVGRLQGLDPEFSIDLIRVEDAPASLLAVIESEGIPL
jgi:predicted nucleotidyltransferase